MPRRLASAPLVAAALALAAIPAAAQPRRQQPDMKIDAATRTQVVEASIAGLNARYVFPDVAKKIESMLRDRMAAHAYDKVIGAIAFAEQLTKDLQAVSHDKHMRMAYRAEPVPPDQPDDAPRTPEDKAHGHLVSGRFNAAFVKAERLDGNVGYLRLDAFVQPDEFAPRAAAAMSFLADTDALIIDLRENHGGDPASVAILVSYLYDDDAEVHINDIYWRPDNSTRQFWTVQTLAGRRYPRKPVYALMSGTTFSGGEEFVYDVQNLKRATLVGEVTGGGANPGGPSKVGEHFALFVPAGRAINPVTKTNWEGVGVKPDVATTAAKALDTAYLAALKLQRARYTAQEAPNLREEIDQALARLEGRK